MGGIARLSNYNHCTNCVTKGLSDLNSNLRDKFIRNFSIMATIGLALITFLFKMSPIGLVIAAVGLVVPYVFKTIQSRDQSYVKNQRRLTKGGLQVAGQTAEIGAMAATAYVTGGNVQAIKASRVVGKAVGSIATSAADNMDDVNMKPINVNVNNRFDFSSVPADKEQRLTHLRNYLYQVGFKKEDVDKASYDKCLKAVMNAGAGDTLHPTVKMLTEKGADPETATVFLAMNGGAV